MQHKSLCIYIVAFKLCFTFFLEADAAETECAVYTFPCDLLVVHIESTWLLFWIGLSEQFIIFSYLYQLATWYFTYWYTVCFINKVRLSNFASGSDSWIRSMVKRDGILITPSFSNPCTHVKAVAFKIYGQATSIICIVLYLFVSIDSSKSILNLPKLFRD